MTTDNSLITFKAISNFTTCLDEVFGKNHKPLKLYAHLISKTTFAHDVPIQKHINAFREFCISNRSTIIAKNSHKFNPKIIKYSSRVYIDMDIILSESDADTAVIIWKHILTISALVDPAGKAKEILQETINKDSENGTEANFLSDIIGKVEEHVNPDSNPMEAVSSIMKSGIFTELVGGMGNGLQDGSLDLGKLMGTVQKMVVSLNGEMGTSDNKDSSGLNSVMESLNSGTQNPNGMPDLGSIMGMMGPMLGALNGNMPSQPPTEIITKSTITDID